MATYKTPGVYVEEISTLPPSVAEVSTAIPVFVGYTERGSGVARIDTMLQYGELFGGAKLRPYSVATVPGGGAQALASITRERPAGEPEFHLHNALDLYFKNGGGRCYVASTGDYRTSAATRADFEAALALIEQEDEPTLIVLTDAVNLPPDDYYALCQQALAQCNELGDRFVILDVQGGDVTTFRNKIGTNHLMYGAAYHPYLQTTLTHAYNEDDVKVSSHLWSKRYGENGVEITFLGAGDPAPEVKILVGKSGSDVSFTVDATVRQLTIANTSERSASEIASAWTTWKASNSAAGFQLAVVGDGSDSLGHKDFHALTAPVAKSLSSMRTTETALYNQVKLALASERIAMPSSAAVAGVYAAIDRDRGVWKAPANVSLSSVIGPVSKISHRAQEDLNIDPTAGKSINAIRAFTGKGTLIWGARTLAGNDNEWRYISVRRLFNLIEESTQKSTAFAVFEPNDETTWLKVRGMIESYLYRLWEQGALAGTAPEKAFFVNVGLGKTMSEQDVLEGRMIVEIGVAAVRPAEFIILRFTHKLQEA